MVTAQCYSPTQVLALTSQRDTLAHAEATLSEERDGLRAEKRTLKADLAKEHAARVAVEKELASVAAQKDLAASETAASAAGRIHDLESSLNATSTGAFKSLVRVCAALTCGWVS